MKKKLKLVYKSNKAILLSNCPDQYETLITLIHSHYKIPINLISLFYKDSDNDYCEILDQYTYNSAIDEVSICLRVIIESKDSSFLGLPQTRPTIPDLTLKFFKKDSSCMAIYNIIKNTLEWIRFPKDIEFKDMATWVEIPNGDIFYCGGVDIASSSRTYIININTKAYSRLENMINPRHSHGVLYDKGFIYAIGGSQKGHYSISQLNSCERYSLDDQVWEDVQDLQYPYLEACACSIENRILVMGRGLNQGKTAGSKEYCFIEEIGRGICSSLPELNSGCMTVVNEKIYLFQGSSLKVYNAFTMDLEETVSLPLKKNWWSFSSPVFYQGAIYFVTPDENTCIFRYELDSKQLSVVFEIVKNY